MSHVGSKSETRTLENKAGVVALFSAMVVTLIAFAAIATGTALAQQAEVTTADEATPIVQTDCSEREASAILSFGSQGWRSG